MSFSLEAEDVGVVFVGSFNPTIFHPEWLRAHDLISADDLDYALKTKETVVHKTVSEFPIKQDLRFLVTVDRLQLLGDFKWNHELRDLAIGIFNLLEHCPVTAMGVNRSMHFTVSSSDELKIFFDKIAQVNKFDRMLKNPIIKTYEIIGGRSDSDEGYILVQISPSPRINPGIMVHLNNHHGKEGRLDLEHLLRKLESKWDPMMSFALETANKIWEI